MEQHKAIAPSITGLYELYGNVAGLFQIRSYVANSGEKSYYGTINDAIQNEFPNAELIISIKLPSLEKGKLVYYIYKNDKLEFLTLGNWQDDIWSMHISVKKLGCAIIPLISYADKTGIVPESKIPTRYKHYNFYTGDDVSGKKIPKNADDLTTSKLFEHINIDNGGNSITYKLCHNSTMTKYENAIARINKLDTHGLYPAVYEYKRAQLNDGCCMAFNCKFKGTEEEIKAHLKAAPDCNYIGQYAASHSKIASNAKSAVEILATYSTIYKAGICRKIFGTTEVEYVCKSPICRFKTNNIHYMYEHYRLLGARGFIIHDYYKNRELLKQTTEAENRDHLKAQVPNPDAKNISVLNYAVHNSHIAFVEDFMADFTDKDAVCKICFVTRPNVISTSCKHVEICSSCMPLYNNKKCLACLVPINYCIIIPENILNSASITHATSANGTS